MRISSEGVQAVYERARALAFELVTPTGEGGLCAVSEDAAREAVEAGYVFIRADNPGLSRSGSRLIVFRREDLWRLCVLTVLIENAPDGPGRVVTEAAQAMAADAMSSAAQERFDSVARDALVIHNLMPLPPLLLTFTITANPGEAARLA
jgi:hypothetical protein